MYDPRFVRSRGGAGGGGSSARGGGAGRESSSSAQERPSEFSRWRERQYFGPRRWPETTLRDIWDKDGSKYFTIIARSDYKVLDK